ncbi:MAG TPA: hypothetical protein VFH95_14500 [Candidatus Kapabacteria bacterium]|nr:hypothetical protein [Candidatus Kapabacteria bacterium]
MMWKKYRIEIALLLAGIGVLIGFAVVQRILLGQAVSSDLYFLGVPLDDVYIHTRFAANLLHGYSYSFNPGQTLTADTSPLWVLLIAIGGIVTSHLELVAIAISMMAYLAIGPGVYRAARDVFAIAESHARIAGIAAVLSSRLAWSGMSGMETALAALLMLLALEQHARSRARKCLYPREALWLALGILVRPEFMFVAAVLIVDWVYAALRARANVSFTPMAAALLIVVASPAFLLPLVTRNSLISHSSVVQGAAISIMPNVRYLWFAIKILASNNVIIFALAGAGIWLLRKEPKYYTLFVIAIGLPLAQAFVAPQFRQSGRYFFPVIPLLVILGIASWEKLERMGRMIVPLIVLAGVIETARWAMIEGESVRNINDQHLAAVSWLRQNMQPSDALAVDDVGAIGYFLNKPVIDLTGLITPQLWPLQHDQDSVWRAARTMGANLFVIYRRLDPPFYEAHNDSLVLQQDFRVRLPLASSADTVMSIYRAKGPNEP